MLSVVVAPAAVQRELERVHRIGLSGCVPVRRAASAQAKIRLDVRAGRHFLQVDGDGFAAGAALEGQAAGGFGAQGGVGDGRVWGLYRQSLMTHHSVGMVAIVQRGAERVSV